LRELARRLNDAGLTVGIRVVGGAAIALINSDRRATRDIDAILLPAEPVQAAAAEMAIERDLPNDWINDPAKAFVPFVGLDEWHEMSMVSFLLAANEAGPVPSAGVPMIVPDTHAEAVHDRATRG
jgi:hypothetical protein